MHLLIIEFIFLVMVFYTLFKNYVIPKMFFLVMRKFSLKDFLSLDYYVLVRH